MLVGHQGVPALLAAQRSVFALHDQARVLAVLSPAFDASLSDLMTAHTSGACLVLPAPGLLQDPNRLLQTLARESITHVDLPPAVVARVDAEQLPSTLECVVMGGEICPPLAARSWARRVRLINVYGPTEATICTSMVQVHPETWTEPDLGTPIPGVLYRVEDEELWIGGDCLAHGYTDAQLTEQCFTHRDGQRWYRTGSGRAHRRTVDLPRPSGPDGQAQGRLAHPEELEEVLMAHPAVTRAAAWAQAAACTARWWAGKRLFCGNGCEHDSRCGCSPPRSVSVGLCPKPPAERLTLRPWSGLPPPQISGSQRCGPKLWVGRWVRMMIWMPSVGTPFPCWRSVL